MASLELDGEEVAMKFIVIIDTGENRREMKMEAENKDGAMEAACKVAERMGGDFMDVTIFGPVEVL